MRVLLFIFHGAIIMSLIFSTAFVSAKSANAAPGGGYEWKLGHQWTFTYDNTQKKGSLWVAIGQWRWRTREFQIEEEYTYPVDCKAGSQSTTCELDVLSRMIEAYEETGYDRGQYNVASVEFYHEIIIEATGTWSGNVEHKAPLAEHPSLRFDTLESGGTRQFQAAWARPSIQGVWSDPMPASNGEESTMRNRVNWDFEEKGEEYSYSDYSITDHNGKTAQLNSLQLPDLPGKKFAFQLAPAKLVITPPSNLNLKTFVVDPRYGSGD